PDAKFRDSATEMTRKASAAATALSLNRGVYQALGALDLSKADAPTRHFVSRQLLLFRPGRSGQRRSDARQAETTERSADRAEICIRPEYLRRPEGGESGGTRSARWPAAGLHRPSQAGCRRH